MAATRRNNALLFSSAPRRYVYLALWIPNGLIVGCESLYVPYALPYGPGYAGALLAFAALGMLAGDLVAGRFLPRRWRGRLGVPLYLLLAAPYPLLALRPAAPAALAVVTVASVGYAGSLLFQERLMALVPDGLTGHALGLQSSGTLTAQGVGAALAGGVAEYTSAGTAMAVLAALSLTVTLALAPGLRPRVSPGTSPAAAATPR